MRGEIIGINTAIVSHTGMYAGIGLAIPADMAKRIMRQLIKSGKVTRGYFGVAIQNVDDKLAKTFGLKTTQGTLVTRVAKGSPADKAGLKERDFIISVNGKKTPDVNHLRNIVAAITPGTTVPVEVYRNGKKRTLKVKIAAQPTDMAAAFIGESSGDQPGKGQAQAQAYGLTVQPLTEKLAKTHGYKKSVKGVVIAEVEPMSSAAETGIRTGMVITHVHDKAVTSVAEFNKAMSAKNAKEGVRIRVMTPEGGAKFIFLTPGK
jgi:serine protease Do